MFENINVQDIVKIAESAGKQILCVYNSDDFWVEDKADGDYISPLTLADTQANEIIVTALKELYPHIPILSEEEKEVPYSERKDWEYFWCVDPLDGTKEFIKRNGDFTVNIALIHKDTPVLGVIYAPVHDTTFYSKLWEGAFKKMQDSISQLTPKSKKNQDTNTFRIVASRSHRGENLDTYVENIQKETAKEIDFVSVGSSLKFTLIADNMADMYPRFVPTMEWDTAAGQAILEELWYSILIYPEWKPLKYNRENLRNPFFIAE